MLTDSTSLLFRYVNKIKPIRTFTPISTKTIKMAKRYHTWLSSVKPLAFPGDQTFYFNVMNYSSPDEQPQDIEKEGQAE